MAEASWAATYNGAGIQQIYGDMGFQFVYAVYDTGLDCAAIDAELTNRGMHGTGAWLEDSSQWVYNNLMDTSNGIPQTLFIGRDMTIREHRVGFDSSASPADFINIIESLLAE